ncbi:MAG: VanW family protein [Coriobacteriales bacterium]|nr:VanW family protein [Coriobacteriales bacterium]
MAATSRNSAGVSFYSATQNNNSKNNTSNSNSGRHSRGSTSTSTTTANSSRRYANTRDRRRKTPWLQRKPVRYTLLTLGCLMVFILAMLATDLIANSGKIHRGVSVAGIEVGGLTVDEAENIINQQLTQRIEAAPVVLYGQKTLALMLDYSRWGPTIELDGTFQDASGAGADPLTVNSWRITAITVQATVDAKASAEEAYTIGRGANFLGERLEAWIRGVDLPGRLLYEDNQVEGLIRLINVALGVPITNADISFQNGRFTVITSAGGIGIDETVFIGMLDRAFLGTERSIEIPLVNLPALIDDVEAQALADLCNQAIALPVTLLADTGESWQIEGSHLGMWIKTRIEGEDESIKLTVYVSADLMKSDLGDILSGYDPGVAPVDASFWVSGSSISIVPSENGQGIDFPKLAVDLEQILFAQESTARNLRLSITTLFPAFSTADAEAMHINQQISSFTTRYGWSTPERANNIEVCAGDVNHTLIAPHQVFSFNDTAGNPAIDRGYQISKVISEGEYIDEVGGGVCQVATTVFNAVYDAGYPIVARACHGLYQWQYPNGRDAAVFYPWLDLKWENDTDNWILLTLACSDGYVTATLWGTPPGYVVKSEAGPFLPGEVFRTERTNNPDLEIGTEKVTQQGQDGRSIYVVRRVYDTQGNLLRESSFYSTYGSVVEKIEVGTKQPERPPDPPPDPTPATPDNSTGTPDPSTGGSSGP